MTVINNYFQKCVIKLLLLSGNIQNNNISYIWISTVEIIGYMFNNVSFVLEGPKLFSAYGPNFLPLLLCWIYSLQYKWQILNCQPFGISPTGKYASPWWMTVPLHIASYMSDFSQIHQFIYVPQILRPKAKGWEEKASSLVWTAYKAVWRRHWYETRTLLMDKYHERILGKLLSEHCLTLDKLTEVVVAVCKVMITLP